MTRSPYLNTGVIAAAPKSSSLMAQFKDSSGMWENKHQEACYCETCAFANAITWAGEY